MGPINLNQYLENRCYFGSLGSLNWLICSRNEKAPLLEGACFGVSLIERQEG
jgi:hypothetical protein